MADSIPKLVSTQFHDRTGRSSHRLQVTEQNRYLDISVYKLQDTEETEQVKEQVEDHRFQCKEEYMAHRLLNRKVVNGHTGYRLQVTVKDEFLSYKLLKRKETNRYSI